MMLVVVRAAEVGGAEQAAGETGDGLELLHGGGWVIDGMEEGVVQSKLLRASGRGGAGSVARAPPARRRLLITHKPAGG